MNTKIIPVGLIATLLLSEIIGMASADTDTLLERGEKAEIQVSLPHDLNANDWFQIEIKPSMGGSLLIKRTAPGIISSVTRLYLSLYPLMLYTAKEVVHTGVEQATSSCELVGDVIGRDTDGDGKIEHISFTIQLTAGQNPVNLNEMTLTYADAEMYVELTPRGDKPSEGRGQWNYSIFSEAIHVPTPMPIETPTPVAIPMVTPSPTPTPTPPLLPISPEYLYVIPIALFLILLPFIFYIRGKKEKPAKTTPEKPLPTLEQKEQEQISPPIFKSVIIERAIYDPCKRDFVKSALPRMKEWINNHDASAYWFAVSIQNNTDRVIEEWGVELETSSALKIKEARVEGIEIEIPHEAHLGLFKISVPKEYGIVIPKGGAQRVYFKLRAEKPKTTYEISGVLKSEITGDVPIQAKEFKYLCDAGVSPEAVKAELKKTFSEKDAARLANTFRIVQNIRSIYCNTNTKAKEINKEFDVLKMYLTEKEFLDEIESIQRRINAELREDERLDETHVEELKNFCGKFTEMWIARFLR